MVYYLSFCKRTYLGDIGGLGVSLSSDVQRVVVDYDVHEK
jgi:hypothetical protein